ncbi:uncharacterized protein Z519_12077 [Cladophialophora bantiana CBS 173.52]|uniref:Uncharacterized protein n=1 Tax=Cladophialophora bantiana (strain ATCC 10958 / CBS 173.52 / CDC B-1940 / NIH 8579) TaxID=1442370 RepID=A0A0D2EBF7_CLAB1|nr:uncharacterized protein Z519_12077 [Cladophialophora bantiana CBS 173.52]KIW87441.1 hypothetical protein Z519_12077 [Cladophialophora bantiana CBS 173.52]
MATILHQTLSLCTMERCLTVTSWDPLQCCSPEELSRLDERFDYALRDITCLVFWTGISPDRARCWAEQHGLPTLTIAMGPLYSDRGAGSLRHNKSPKAWSKYMKAASGRFAEYACRSGRQAVVLTNPPPGIYSTRERSNYRDLEEPILKGASGGPGTTRIEYVHPLVAGAATFQYQIWPFDNTSAWYIFFKNLLAKGGRTRDSFDISVKNQVAVKAYQIPGGVVQLQNNAQLPNETKLLETQTQAETAQNRAQAKKEAKRKRFERERQRASEKKEAERKQVELEHLKAREKEAKRQRHALDLRMIQEKKEAKRQRHALELRIAQEKKEAKRKRLQLSIAGEERCKTEAS